MPIEYKTITEVKMTPPNLQRTSINLHDILVDAANRRYQPLPFPSKNYASKIGQIKDYMTQNQRTELTGLKLEYPLRTEPRRGKILNHKGKLLFYMGSEEFYDLESLDEASQFLLGSPIKTPEPTRNQHEIMTSNLSLIVGSSYDI